MFKLIHKITLRVSRQLLLFSGLHHADKQQHTEIHSIRKELCGSLIFQLETFHYPIGSHNLKPFLLALILSLGYSVLTLVG